MADRHPSSLLKIQIGPVQDFIAAARSTRDLWSGSYLLSWLAAVGIRHLAERGGSLIFPNPGGQPLLGLPKLPDDDHRALLTPNLPNLFVAFLPEETAEATARDVEQAIRNEWQAIADAVWSKHAKLDIPGGKKSIFERAVAGHLSISWQVTPVGDYVKSYAANGKHLDAVRQLRDFHATGEGAWRLIGEKDSLTGREEALCGGTGFKDAMATKGGEIPSLFKHADHVGAITLIKRVWHIAYLAHSQIGIQARSNQFPIRSLPAIAARRDELDDDRDGSETSGGEKYIAAIAFDGDQIGKWVSGELLAEGADLREHQEKFSGALSDFALKRVRAIVEGLVDGQDKNGKPMKVPLGQLIYAGGDDVVCLVPADAAIKIAAKLREAFREATSSIAGQNGARPDASCGIAIAHIHAPLQDLIREAQKAEKRAKNEVGRPAFAVTLMKRSGEITLWGSQWESGGLELQTAIAGLLATGELSAKFPHRFCQLLVPYLTRQSGLAKLDDAIGDFSTMKSLIDREFAFAAERQGSQAIACGLQIPLHTYLDGIHREREKRASESGKPSLTEFQDLLTSLIGLCTSVAFAHRNLPAEKQPTP